MGDYHRGGVYVLGGVLLGVIGSVLIGQQKGRLRPAATTLLSKGLDMKDQAAAAFEVAKEQTEDLFAEAEDLRQNRTSGGRASSASPHDSNDAS